MYKVISLFLLICCGFSLMALQDKSNGQVFKQQSQKSIYQSVLECNKKITTGSFQSCSFKLLNAGKEIKNTEIFMNGGMPAHQHGLPTAPKLVWTEDTQTYLIKGLKFSMPGKWVLTFKVNAKNDADKDMISMEINVI